MKIRRLLPLLVFAFILPMLLCSCSQSDAREPEDILNDILSHVSSLHAGARYKSGCEEWEDGYMSQGLKNGLYAMADGSTVFDDSIEKFAIYLSSSQSGGEVAVFLCIDTSHTEDVIRMCISRADLAKELRPELGGCEYIVSSGRYVVMVLLPVGELDESDIRSALR